MRMPDVKSKELCSARLTVAALLFDLLSKTAYGFMQLF